MGKRRSARWPPRTTAADDAGLPADPEFRDALRSYMEWAVSEVLSHQGDDPRVAADLPVPRWTWTGLVR